MRVLLDTHTLLWYTFGDRRLSQTALGLLDSAENDRLGSLWEIAIKVSIGRLGLTVSYPEFVRRAVHENDFALLPIMPAHVEAVHRLPFPAAHRDPFDRLLVAQAVTENVPLVTCDNKLAVYPITRVW